MVTTTNITSEGMLDCLISKFLKTSKLDWMIFISAWPIRMIFFLIFFRVKNKWLRKLHNCFLNHFRGYSTHLIQKVGNFRISHFFSSSFLLIEMPSLNQKERVACLEYGREYNCKDWSRHRTTYSNKKISSDFLHFKEKCNKIFLHC